MSLAFLLAAALTGFFIVRLAWPNALRLCRHDVLRLSLGTGIGLGIASLVTFVSDAALGGGATVVVAADLFLLAVAAAAYFAFRRSAPCPFCAHESTQGGTLLSAAAAAAVIFAVAAFGLYTATNPYGEWDAWAIWNNHARFLASGSSWTQMFAPALVWSVQDYPLLIPGAIANVWMASGSTSAMVPPLVSALLLFGAAGVLFGVLDLVRGCRQALIATVTLFGAASLIHTGASQYADVPLAFFYVSALGILCIPDAYPADRQSWWLAGASAGCAAWTKNEGMVFLAVVIAVRVWVSFRARSFDGKGIALMLAGASPFVGALLWFKTAFAPANYLFVEQQQSLGTRLADVSRYMTVAVEFGRQLFVFGGWLLPPVLLAVGYFWLMGKSGGSGSGRSSALITLAAMTLAYAGVYVVTTKDLNWQIETSLPRVLMQLWPTAVLVFFEYVREVRAVAAPQLKPKPPKQEKRRRG